MGRLFANLTAEREQALTEERRKDQFFTAWRLPLMWQMCARRHKRAADILYEIGYEAHEREITRLLAEPTEADGGQTDVNVARTRAPKGEGLADHLDMDLLGDYFLLAGYALECILKGCLLALKPDWARDDGKINRVIITHHLCQLCDDCAITLSEEERELLDLITRYVVWGKYAAPVRLGDTPSWIDPDDQKTKSLCIASPFHQRREQSLVNRVYEQGLDLLNSLGDARS